MLSLLVMRYKLKPEYHKWYGRNIWVKELRPSQLRKQPLCQYCEQQGEITIATIVDHIKPHKGDYTLFTNPVNLQSLCKLHHDSSKQAEEAGDMMLGHTLDGAPLDRNHHWYTTTLVN